MKLNTDSVTGGADPTARTEWGDGFADSLSEGYEEAVKLLPVSDGDGLPQSELGPGGCFGFDEP